MHPIRLTLMEVGRLLRLNVLAPLVHDRLKYGNDFWRMYSFLKRSEEKPAEWHKTLQEYRLRRLIHYAYERTPFYRRLFRTLDLHPSDIRTLEDLQKMPVLTKEQIADNTEDMIAVDYSPLRIKHLTTGGSTGVPTNLYQDSVITEAREWAFIRAMWDRVGFSERAKSAILRGDHLDERTFPNHYRYNWATRSLILSSFHLDSQTLARYVALLQRYSPAFYLAYPSSMSVLCRHIARNDCEMPSPRGVMLASEGLAAPERRLIETVLGGRVFTHYGQSERVILAGECEVSRCYHVFPEYGICEILSPEGERITEPDEKGSIVGTGFNNPVMPLIRYNTEDVSSWVQGTCDCGREYPLMNKVDGRTSDSVVISISGRPVPVTALNPHEEFFDKVSMFQFQQSKLGEVTLLVVPSHRYKSGDLMMIERFFSQRLGNGFTLSAEIVDNIEPTSSGKRNMLVQQIDVRRHV